MKAAVIDIHMSFFYVPQRVLYLDDLSNTDNPYFDLMVVQIYPPELQLNKVMSLIPKLHIWININLFQTDWFQLQFIISAMTSILP